MGQGRMQDFRKGGSEMNCWLFARFARENFWDHAHLITCA